MGIVLKLSQLQDIYIKEETVDKQEKKQTRKQFMYYCLLATISRFHSNLDMMECFVSPPPLH